MVGNQVCFGIVNPIRSVKLGLSGYYPLTRRPSTENAKAQTRCHDPSVHSDFKSLLPIGYCMCFEIIPNKPTRGFRVRV